MALAVRRRGRLSSGTSVAPQRHYRVSSTLVAQVFCCSPPLSLQDWNSFNLFDVLVTKSKVHDNKSRSIFEKYPLSGTDIRDIAG